MTSKQSSHFTTEEEVLRQVYAAINRNDIEGVLKFFDPQIERVEPPGFPSSGTYRGHAEVQTQFERGRATWAEGSCEPKSFTGNGDKVVVMVHVRVRLKEKLEWIDAHIADGFVFRNGKIIQMHTFVVKQEALEWAGISAGV